MPPRRKLSEIVTSARINKKFCNLLVEGPSDHIIIRSFCEGAEIPVVIYPLPSVEIDCVEHGEGGNRERLVKISEYASGLQIERTLCIIDRDNEQWNSFEFNSHCLITDLGCIDMYALDVNELRGYLSRSFHIEITPDQMQSIVASARSASCMRWAREGMVENTSLANIDGSLSIQIGSVVSIDLMDWLNRSRTRGGSPEQWNALGDVVPDIAQIEIADFREEISVHQLDEVLRFWLRRAAGIPLPERWLEGHLRGLATYERLRQFPFFITLGARCAIGTA